jgi:hypothetical protein
MNDWKPIKTAPRDCHQGKFLVTNNLEARDPFGYMSHLWLTSAVFKDGNQYAAYADTSWNTVFNLTHWREL